MECLPVRPGCQHLSAAARGACDGFPQKSGARQPLLGCLVSFTPENISQLMSAVSTSSTNTKLFHSSFSSFRSLPNTQPPKLVGLKKDIPAIDGKSGIWLLWRKSAPQGRLNTTWSSCAASDLQKATEALLVYGQAARNSSHDWGWLNLFRPSKLGGDFGMDT